jgi:hypothetical protein
MADKTYGPKTYQRDNGDTFVIAPGGRLENQDYGTVTQITSTTTGVTLNTLTGSITTIAGTLAAGAEEAFTVTDSRVAATDTVVACLASTASAGSPQVAITAVAAGSFQITVSNFHAANALNALLVINFTVFPANV